MQTSRWPVSKLPITHLTPFPYHKGELYVELLDRLAKYVTQQLHPNLRETVEHVVEEMEHIIADTHGKYVEGVQDFQRIHDAFMEDVNSALMALNDNAVADLVSDPWSSIGVTLRDVFTPKSEFETLAANVTRGTIRAVDYGAVGDGVTDDTVALQAALDEAVSSKSLLLLEPGATYAVSQTISSNGGSVFIKTEGEPATIKGGGQLNVLEMSVPVRTVHKQLIQPAYINRRQWQLNTVDGVEPGMIMQVKSSKSWYFDPRPDTSDARKSELHVVDRVSGSTVHTVDVANDGYDTTQEFVEVFFHRPNTVQLENIIIRGDQQPSANGRTGISIQGAYRPQLRNVTVIDQQYTGIFIQDSYEPSVIGGTVSGANGMTTGYGVQFYGCSYGVVRDYSFYGCRRGVDVSGGDIISIGNSVENCHNHGGGVRADGEYYGWTPNGEYTSGVNYGFGTHGAADRTTYRNNTTRNVHQAFSLRGGNEVISGHKHVGQSRGGVINLITGANLVAENIVLEPGALAISQKNTATPPGQAIINHERADSLLRVHDTYDIATADIHLSNIQANVFDKLIELMDGAIPQRYLTLNNITVIFATASGAVDVHVIWYGGEEGAVAPFRWQIGALIVTRVGGTGQTLLTNMNPDHIRKSFDW